MSKKDPTYTASVVCAVAGSIDKPLNANTLTAWRTRGLLEMDKPGQSGWTRYTFGDLVRACALAELSRVGLTSPREGLLGELEKDLREQLGFAEQRPKGGGKVEVRYLLAQLTSPVTAVRVLRGQLPAAVTHLWASAEGGRDDADNVVTTVVIDTAKLARRIVKRLRDLGERLPFDGP